jgi:hypothetical protein
VGVGAFAFVVAGGLMIVGSAGAGAASAGQLLPHGASSVAVAYHFGPAFSPFGWRTLPVIVARSRRQLARLMSAIDGPARSGQARRMGGDCSVPEYYTLQFRYKNRKQVGFEVGCGWAERQSGCSACGVQIGMGMVYTLAQIMRRDTHSRRLCRQWWHRRRLRLCNGAFI